MVKCGLCSKEFKDSRGLQGHVTGHHKVPWKDYQQQFNAQTQTPPALNQNPPPPPPPPPAIAADKPPPKVETPPPQTPLNVSPETIEMLRGEMTKVAKEEMGRLMEGASDKVTGKLPEGVTPVGEEVEIIGEKINYKVALNPEIFFIYGIFKMEADRKGNKWGGDFSDFLYMAAKDVLVAHGLRPAVISVKEGSLYRVSMEGS